MAFKNILTPNQATGTDFYGDITGFSAYNANETVSSTTEKAYQGNRSLKCVTLSSLIYSGITTPTIATTSGKKYTLSGKVYAPLNQPMRVVLYNPSTVYTFNGTGDWYSFTLTMTSNSTTTWFRVQVNGSYATTFYIDGLQLEQADSATAWEFPGINMVGQAISGQESVNPLKLNQILTAQSVLSGEAFGFPRLESELNLNHINSLEQVNSLILMNKLNLNGILGNEYISKLILENVLNLTGLESSEEISNLDLQNLLELQGVGSAESINNLTLQNLLELQGVGSAESINNLTLQNLLELQGILSSEIIPNLDVTPLITKIYLEGIPSDEAIPDLLVYIYYRRILAELQMRKPHNSFNMKSPRTEFKLN